MENKLIKSACEAPYSILADLIFAIPTGLSCMVSETCTRLKDERDFWRDQHKKEVNKTLAMQEHIEILEEILERLENEK